MNEPPQQIPPPPGQIQPQYGGQVPPVQKTNGMAIAALVSGLLGLTMCPVVGSVLALIFGYVGRGQIKRSHGSEGGDGMAIAGIVLGWIGVVLSLVFLLAVTLGAFAVFNFAAESNVQEVLDEGQIVILEGSLEEVGEREADCTPVERYPDMGADHIRPGQPHEPYNSNPPTSGPHYDRPADPGFYEPSSAIEPERLVHNLEHGQVVIWYRPHVNEFLEEQVEQLVAQEPNATVAAPFENINDPYNIVLTTWTRARACVNVSQEVVDEFRRRFQGRAPEPLTPRFNG
ncbi:MAG: DUF3105 domain-containing protein [Actinobacteria bacterium]|nr:DUF3105 domain-containing protein [Actinomycetota bacterium]